MIIVPGPASSDLGMKIARRFDVPPCPADYRQFPDGENYIRLTCDVKDETVAIVQTTAINPDSKLMQLLLIAGTAVDFGAKHIIAVIPYLAYSRQDKRFLEREALSLDIVFRLLEGVGVRDLIVVDAHNSSSLRELEKKHSLSVHNLSAIPLLASELKSQNFDGAYCLSPDKGAIHLVEMASKVIGGDYGFFDKYRNRTTGDIEMKVKDLQIIGKKAVVFDDIISSGGTMAHAIEALKSQGAEKLAAACSHALFMGGAEEKIRRAGADIILASDTVSTQFSQVTVADLIADKLIKID